MRVILLAAAMCLSSLSAGNLALAEDTPDVDVVLGANQMAAVINTAKNYLIMAHKNSLENANVSLQNCIFRVVEENGDLRVYVSGFGISGSLLLAGDTLDILEDQIQL